MGAGDTELPQGTGFPCRKLALLLGACSDNCMGGLFFVFVSVSVFVFLKGKSAESRFGCVAWVAFELPLWLSRVLGLWAWGTMPDFHGVPESSLHPSVSPPGNVFLVPHPQSSHSPGSLCRQLSPCPPVSGQDPAQETTRELRLKGTSPPIWPSGDRVGCGPGLPPPFSYHLHGIAKLLSF